MNKIIPALLLYCALISTGTITANDIKPDTLHNRFFYKNDGVRHYYTKVEPSGCKTTVRIKNNSPTVGISYGGRYNNSPNEKEDTIEIANSVYEIINYFSLEKIIKSKTTLSIHLAPIMSHGFLIQYINEDNEWPNNFYEYFSAKSPDRKKSFALYVEYLRQEIVKSNIFVPFISVMKKFDCNMYLKDRYVDGIFFERHHISKKDLIEWGFYKEGQAKKDIYPALKGGIEFKLECR